MSDLWAKVMSLVYRAVTREILKKHSSENSMVKGILKEY